MRVLAFVWRLCWLVAIVAAWWTDSSRSQLALIALMVLDTCYVLRAAFAAHAHGIRAGLEVLALRQEPPTSKGSVH